MKRTRKTKPAPKRRRRSAYDRALHDATERLDKALSEQVAHQTALESLATEIPRLQRIIGALEPDDAREQWQAESRVVKVNHRRFGKTGDTAKPNTIDQAEFLSRFVKAVETNVMRATPPVVIIDENSDEPFLPPVAGEELLP